jgi:hypothetical protein
LGLAAAHILAARDVAGEASHFAAVWTHSLDARVMTQCFQSDRPLSAIDLREEMPPVQLLLSPLAPVHGSDGRHSLALQQSFNQAFSEGLAHRPAEQRAHVKRPVSGLSHR